MYTAERYAISKLLHGALPKMFWWAGTTSTDIHSGAVFLTTEVGMTTPLLQWSLIPAKEVGGVHESPPSGFCYLWISHWFFWCLFTIFSSSRFCALWSSWLEMHLYFCFSFINTMQGVRSSRAGKIWSLQEEQYLWHKALLAGPNPSRHTEPLKASLNAM